MREITQILLFGQYIPHGHCYLWQTPLVALHVLSDAFIAIAYYLIPIFLIYFVRQRQDVPFKRILILFSAFILSCGTTHVIAIVTLWQPIYWISGTIKAITALISLYTAFSLIHLIPQILDVPSASQLEALNKQLEKRVIEKENAEAEILTLNQELEQRVTERTTALSLANQNLQASQKFAERITTLIPDIIYIYDINKKQNIYCNPFINEVLGFTVEKIQNYQSNLLTELIHPADLELVEQHFEKCYLLEEDNYLETEYRIKDIKGEWHWFHDKNTIFKRDLNGQPQQILGIAQDITNNKKAQIETDKLTQTLAEKVTALEVRNQEGIKLAEMNEFLQACLTIEEAKQTLADLLMPLFTDVSGAVYLINNSHNFLEIIAAWGTIDSHHIIESNECWGLRRGSPHICKSITSSLSCSHIKAKNNLASACILSSTLCLPMMAKGETLGMFYLQFNGDRQITRSIQELGTTVAQNIGMAFANLQLQETLKYQSLRDPLTGLFNRRYLQESLEKEIDRATRKKHSIGIMIIDIDHFKRFNDTYGHEAGDLVLKEVGTYLIQQTRQYDIACRYGGEELIIVMPDASLENTILRAEEIRQGIEQLQLKHQGILLQAVTISVGVSCFPDDGSELESLIRIADKGLYQAKEQGRNRVVRC
jgi:diguanylate cyclase (GGDEF)-like protein/PAS domain S-box-containing protein